MAYNPVKYGLMSGVGRGLGRAGESIARGMMAGYARDERERVRAEDLRRYEAQQALEAARHKERMGLERAGLAFAAGQKEAAMPAERALEMRPATLGYYEALEQPVGPGARTVTPRTLDFAEALEAVPSMPMPGELPPVSGEPARPGAPFTALPEPARPRPRPVSPLETGTQALMQRALKERGEVQAEKHRKTRGDLASMIGKVAPLVAAEVTQEGHVDEPVTPEHYRDLVRRSREEELWRTKAKEAAKVVARRAASRGKHRIDLLNGYAGFISKSLRNNDKAGLTAGVVEMRRLIGGDEKDSVSAAEDIWGAKASKDRTQLGRVMWTTTAPVLRDEIRTANAQIRALVGQPAALLTHAGRKEIDQLRGSVSRAKNELNRLGHQAGLSPEVITLEIDAGPKSEDDFLGLAKQWADTWGLTLEQSADRLRDMGYEIE